ncbi:MAG: type I methionyl aminopeptidase [Patescibacteria group bacterium]|nr:type I methionyl aminopeptidase [Patescibacteria group bacterium]
MITIKTPKEIEIMRDGGRILAKIMEELKKKVAPGITTKELDRVAETLVLKYKAQPAFKGYENFPATLCTSVNEVIVHAAPSDYQLKEGDILSLDLGIKYPAPVPTMSGRCGPGKSFFTDMAITLLVKSKRGRTPVNFETLRLIKVTKKALKLAIKKVRPGKTFEDIGYTVQRYVESQGFNVVRELCGHGIGRELHEDPKILNYGRPVHKGEKIKEGMVFCLEPMVTMGDWHIKKSPDGFGYETKDGSLSCHFEHTVAVTKDGCQLLTELK